MAQKVATTAAKDDEKSAGKTMIRSCTCVSTFQDARYNRMRVHNVGKGKVSCTVCGTEKIK
jgi:hypothetical protein